MPTPTPLSICTSSLTRLLKEERSYHAELAMQQKNLERLQTTAAAEAEGAAEENREFVLRQEVSKALSLPAPPCRGF